MTAMQDFLDGPVYGTDATTDALVGEMITRGDAISASFRAVWDAASESTRLALDTFVRAAYEDGTARFKTYPDGNVELLWVTNSTAVLELPYTGWSGWPAYVAP